MTDASHTSSSPASESALPPQMINACFMLAWEEFGDDKSTEFLVQITADRLGIDPAEVYEALASEVSATQRDGAAE